MKTRGTALELERRRQRAVDAVRIGGLSPTVVAIAHGVHRVTVQRWLRQAKTPGGLGAKPAPHPCGIPDDQLSRLEALLLQGPRAHGWDNDLWTAARVAEVIRREFGIAYHPEHVRKILKRRLGWSSQKPARRARPRDEDGRARWKNETFPAIAQAARERGAHLVFLDESGFPMSPTVRRTYAKRGHTPVLKCDDARQQDLGDQRDHVDADALSAGPGVPPAAGEAEHHGGAGRGVFEGVAGADAAADGGVGPQPDPQPVEGGAGLPYLAGHPEIVAEDFPGYAPERNPDEMVWGWVKYGRLANYAPPDEPPLRARVETELAHLKTHAYELLPFLDHTGLPMAA